MAWRVASGPDWWARVASRNQVSVPMRTRAITWSKASGVGRSRCTSLRSPLDTSTGLASMPMRRSSATSSSTLSLQSP